MRAIADEHTRTRAVRPGFSTSVSSARSVPGLGVLSRLERGLFGGAGHGGHVLRLLERGLLGNAGHGIFMLNIELGKRALSVPSNFTEMGGGH